MKTRDADNAPVSYAAYQESTHAPRVFSPAALIVLLDTFARPPRECVNLFHSDTTLRHVLLGRGILFFRSECLRCSPYVVQ